MSSDQLNGTEGMIERWDEHAKTYDEESKQFSSAVSHFVDWELLKGYLPQNKEARVLDAAGGTGRVTLPLAKLGYSVTLCDISLGMLSVAKQKLLREGVLNKVEIIQCDAHNLHFRDESFDFSLCWFGPLDVTKELVRVTKRGGRISMYLQNICQAAIRLFSENPDAALTLLKSPSKFHNTEKYRFDRAIRIEDAAQLFESEGIRILDVYDTAGGLLQYLLTKEALESRQWDEGYFRQVTEMVLRLNQEPSIKGMSKWIMIYGEKI
jgi:ubiquinone/menaquinone biosynthesis C-methylase UbiE